VDRDPVSVGVAFVVLDREHRFVTAGLSVALYDVLINVNALLHLSPSEKAVGIATGTGEVGDDDFIIVRVDVVVVAALDHLLAALEATAPVKVLVVLVAHGATYFS
jgi:hypothetical protein